MAARNIRSLAAVVFILILGVLLAFIYLHGVDRWKDEQTARIETSEVNPQETEQDTDILHTRVAMKWFFAGTMAPYFAGKTDESRVFEKAKIDVELVPGGPTAPSIDQVLLGRADFGITGAHDLALARSKDQPLVAVAVLFRRSPTCIVTLAESGITTPEDLDGKTIELTQGDNSEFEVLAMLKKAGVDIPQSRRPLFRFNYDSLIARRVDGAVAYENDQAVSLAAHRRINIIAPANNGVTPYGDVLFATEETIQNRPELVTRVVTGFLSAWLWAFNNVDECTELFLHDPQIQGLDLDKNAQVLILRKSIEFVRPQESYLSVNEAENRIGFQEVERWQETLSLIEAYSTEDFLNLPNPEECFTNRFTRFFQMQIDSPVSATDSQSQ